MFALGAPDAGEAVVQYAAFEILLHQLDHHGPQRPVFGLEPLVVYALELLEASVEGLPEPG